MSGRPAPLPNGFAIRLAPGTRVLAGGEVLIGGSPTRLLRLRPRAAALLAGGRLTVTDPGTAALARRLLDTAVAHPDPAATTAPIPGPGEVTVVIPVLGDQAGIDRLLAALDPQLPVIVVDDGSPVPIRAMRPGTRVLRHESPRGPAAARNTGLAAVTTALVAFLDADTVPGPDWLTSLLTHLADPACVLVAPRITALTGSGSALARYEALRSALDMGPDPAPVIPLSPVAYVPSAALLVRREALAGGFDEQMHVAEDVDLCWRLHAAGARMRYEPAAAVAHDHRTGHRAWLARRAFYGTGAAALDRRHAGTVAPLVLTGWSALAAAGLASGTRTGAAVAAAATARAGWRMRPVVAGIPRADLEAARLTLRGLRGACAQTAQSALRHHWPIALVAAAVSRRARRLLAAAAVIDGAIDWYRRGGPGTLDPVRYIAYRRLDDLAYGAGLWTGAVRTRRIGALLPRSGTRTAGR